MSEVLSLKIPIYIGKETDQIPAVSEAHLAVARLLWKDLDEKEFRTVDTSKIAKELGYPKEKVQLIILSSLFVKRIVDKKIMPRRGKGAIKYGYRKERSKVKLLVGNSRQVKEIIDLNEMELKK